MRKYLLIICFFLIMWLPIAGMLFSPPKRPPDFRSFKEVEYYFFENMGFKQTFNRWYSNLLFYGFNTIPFSHIVQGKDGIFFHKTNINQWCQQQLFGPYELQSLIADLEINRAQLKKRNIRYLIVIAPTKEAVYQASLPDYEKCSPDDSRIAQILRATNMPLINLLPILRESATKEHVYYKTSNLLNGYGQLSAYKAIIKALNIAPPESFSKRQITYSEGSLVKLMNVSGLDEIDEIYLPESITASPYSTFIIHSSHLKDVANLLRPHFSKLSVIEQSFRYRLDMDQIDKIKPNILIHQIVLETNPYSL